MTLDVHNRTHYLIDKDRQQFSITLSEIDLHLTLTPVVILRLKTIRERPLNLPQTNPSSLVIGSLAHKSVI